MKWIHENNRIYSQDDQGGLIAEVTFPAIGPSKVDINHTYTAPALRGQGIAGRMMLAAVEAIRAQNQKAVATCPYAVKWFENHPEHADVLAENSK